MSSKQLSLAQVMQADGTNLSWEGGRTRRSTQSRLLHDNKVRVGGLILALLCLASIAAPWVAPADPIDQQLTSKLHPPAWEARGSWSHPLGTDEYGRDVLSRVIYGGRISLVIGFFATVGAAIFGVLVGLISGYYSGRIDSVIMRIVDIQMAFPTVILAMAVIAALGSTMSRLILVLAISNWVLFARIVRADVLSIKHREFVEAGRAVGATEWRLLSRYVAPNVVGSVTVVATLTIATTIVVAASLSFLGLGVPPPTASWGGMLADGRDFLGLAWWIATFPGIALMITVIAINLLGDALRDVLDPRLAAAG